MDKKGTILVLSLLGLSSLLCRMPGLLESIWYDEACRTAIFLNAERLNRILFHDVHNFLYNGVMYLWIQVFGDSEISIRFPSLLLGYASILVFCHWIYRRLGRPTAAGVLVFLLFSPFHIWYSTEAKNNVMVMFFAVMIFVSYANLMEKQEWKWIAWAVLAGVLGVFTDFLLLFALSAPLVISLVVLKKHPGNGGAKKMWTALAITACLALPLILFKAYHQEEMVRGYLKAFTLQELYLLLCNFLSNGNAVLTLSTYRGLASLSGYWQAAFLLFTSLVVIVAQFRGLYALVRTREGAFVSISFLLPIVLMFGLSWYVSFRFGGKHEVYLERTLGSVIFYFYALILVYGSQQLRTKALRRGLLGVILAVNLLGAVLMLTVHRDEWTIYKPNPDWRSLSSDVMAVMGDAMVFTSCNSLALQYYLKAFGDRAVFFNPPLKDGIMYLGPHIQEAFEKRQIRSPRFFYIVINRYWDPKKLAVVNREAIGKLYEKVEENHYFGLAVYKYRFKYL